MTPVMTIVLDCEMRLRARKTSVSAICRAANLDRVTWHRWKSGALTPRAESWRAVQGALRPIIGEVADLPGAATAEAA